MTETGPGGSLATIPDLGVPATFREAGPPAAGHVVVVGGGPAGGEAAVALRAAGFGGAITIVGEEIHLPYARPPLSKGYLLATVAAETLPLRPAGTYDAHDIRVLPGRRALAVDRSRRVLELDDGSRLAYSDLVLATGGTARALPGLAADPASGVHCLRTIQDVDALRPTLVAGRRLLVVGGGYIGLEVGSVARRLGLEVTVVEAGPRVLGRVASAVTSAFFTRIHREEGVEVLTSTTVREFHRGAGGAVQSVTLSDGTQRDVDAVLVGIGITPNTAVAAAAGLAVDDGVVVDEYLRTADPNIYAIGDVARFPAPDGSGLLRLESTPNAAEQARVVADVLTGRPRPYETEPWFWSEQFDVKLQVAGVSRPTDACVTRGDPSSGRRLCVFYLRDGAVRAVDVAGSPKDFALGRKLVGQRAVVPAAALADEATPLRDLVALAATQ